VAFQLRDSTLLAVKLFELDPALVASPGYLRSRGRALRNATDLAKHELPSVFFVRQGGVAPPKVRALRDFMVDALKAHGKPKRR